VTPVTAAPAPLASAAGHGFSASGFTYHFLVVSTWVCPALRAPSSDRGSTTIRHLPPSPTLPIRKTNETARPDHAFPQRSPQGRGGTYGTWASWRMPGEQGAVTAGLRTRGPAPPPIRTARQQRASQGVVLETTYTRANAGSVRSTTMSWLGRGSFCLCFSPAQSWPGMSKFQPTTLRSR